ncbi:MAG: glycosyltransferase [Chloroflexi bacterium]|nr:glycosyltransferase [Chloroflexota bacterium]
MTVASRLSSTPADPPAIEAPARSLRVTIVAANTFEFDSRFLRTATTLAADGHRLRILGWSGVGLPEHEELAPGVWLTRLDIDRRITTAVRPLPERLRTLVARVIGLDPAATVLSPDPVHGLDRARHLLRRLLEMAANARRVGAWTDAVLAEAPNTDVFHAQSLIALPVVRKAARQVGGRFVYDVADYHTEAARLARMPWVVRELVRRRERRWVADASGFLAVSDPVAELIARRFRVERPAVLLNCPPAWRPEEPGVPVSVRLRTAAGIAPGRPIVLYQGGFSVDRGVEELVAAADEAPLRELDTAVVFLGYGRLQGFVDDAAAARPGRVYVLPAVPVEELLEWTAGADVSFVGQPPRTLNQRMNLPNKLFESLMAGVPVVVSKGNEQCRLTMAEGVGTCVDIDSPAAIAKAIAALLRAPAEERARLRQHCRTVALTRYTWDLNAGGLLALYRRLALGPGRRSLA